MPNEPPTLLIMEQIEPHTPRPFRLVEVFITSDGMRSRICSGCWLTVEGARAEVQSRIKARSS